jgi:hypothetical protein
MAPVTRSSTFPASKDLSAMRAVIGANDVQLGGFRPRPQPQNARRRSPFGSSLPIGSRVADGVETDPTGRANALRGGNRLQGEPVQVLEPFQRHRLRAMDVIAPRQSDGRRAAAKIDMDFEVSYRVVSPLIASSGCSRRPAQTGQPFRSRSERPISSNGPAFSAWLPQGKKFMVRCTKTLLSGRVGFIN